MRRSFAVGVLLICALGTAAPTPPPATNQDLQRRLDSCKSAYAKHDYPAALELCKDGLAEARKQNDLTYIARFLNNVGTVEETLGRYADAAASYQEALASERRIHDRKLEASTLNNSGIVDEDLGHYAEALAAYRQALAIDRELRDRAGEASSLNDIGIVQQELGVYGEALAAERQALAISRAIHDRSGEANDLGNIGDIEESLGRYADALAMSKQALAIHRGLHNLSGESRSLENIAIVNENLGRYADALRAVKEALALDREIHDRLGESNDLTITGVADYHLGHYTDALAIEEQALAIDRDLGNKRGEANDFTNIGNVEGDMGRYVDALAAQRQALAINRSIQNRSEEAGNLGNIANIDAELGLYADALAAYAQSLAIDREIGDPLGQANTLNNIAIVDESLNRYDEALAQLERSLAMYRKLRNRIGEAESLGIVAIVDQYLGRYNQALSAAEQAVAIDRAIRNRSGEDHDLGNIGNIDLRLGRYADARREAAASVALAGTLGDADIWKGLRTLALAETKLGRKSETVAQKHFDEALDQIEHLRAGLASQSERTSFFGEALFVYDEYIAYLLDLNRRYPGKGYDRKALQILERKAARSALEQIGASAAQHFSGVPANIVEQENLADAALSAAQNRYSKLLSDANADRIAASSAKSDLNAALHHQSTLEAQVKARYPQYYALRHPQPIGVDRIQGQALKPGQVMLIYDLLADRSVLWVVTPQHFKLLALPGSKVIDNAVAALHRHVESIESSAKTPAHDLASFARDSYALYRILIPREAAHAVVSAGSLVVVPSGSLYALPFEALVTRDPAKTARPQYLIQDLPVSYVPSASLLAVVSRSYGQRHRAARNLLAFANPTFGVALRQAQGDTRAALQIAAMRSSTVLGDFPPLPGTQTEANGVRDALHAPTDSVISGDDATRARVLGLNGSGSLADYRYLLFATHAVLPDQIKGLTQPAIVLAHPERGDGFLTMADIFGLKLNADFVTLSACDTGVVSNPSGDGISGLTRAFLYAGTPAISVTLWQVDDAAAPQITPPFFAAMQKGQTASQALRAAQLAMIRSDNPRFSHPFAWAPFVIFGDGDLVAKDLRSGRSAAAPPAENHWVRR